MKKEMCKYDFVEFTCPKCGRRKKINLVGMQYYSEFPIDIGEAGADLLGNLEDPIIMCHGCSFRGILKIEVALSLTSFDGKRTTPYYTKH